MSRHIDTPEIKFMRSMQKFFAESPHPENMKAIDSILKTLEREAWIDVNHALPEDWLESELLSWHKDTHLVFTSVLVQSFSEPDGRLPMISTKNRLIIKPIGIESIDSKTKNLNEWHWSQGAELVTHWRPLPSPIFHERMETKK